MTHSAIDEDAALMLLVSPPLRARRAPRRPDRVVPNSRTAVAQLVEQILDALRAGKNVALHCRQGIGRSALIAAAALISDGQDAETAIRTVRQSRGLEVPETRAQRQWISDFSSWLADKRAAQP